MKLIKLTNCNEYTQVDNDNYEELSKYFWRKRKDGYVVRTIWINKTNQHVGLHQQVMGHKGIDHINNDKLDNRKNNLRPANQRQNSHNRKKAVLYKGVPTSSKYKGVTFNKTCRKWQVSVDGKYSGIFSTETEAAKKYNETAKSLFGNFAKLNEIGVA